MNDDLVSRPQSQIIPLQPASRAAAREMRYNQDKIIVAVFKELQRADADATVRARVCQNLARLTGLRNDLIMANFQQVAAYLQQMQLLGADMGAIVQLVVQQLVGGQQALGNRVDRILEQ